MKFILSVIGMVMFLEGLPYFLFPEKTKTVLEEIKEFSPTILRSLGFILLIMGLMLTFISYKFLR
jgi:hypothetical protein